MATNDVTGAPYLDGNDAPDLAGITKQIADWTAQGYAVLKATDEADRDARYGAVPAPCLVVSSARPAAWLKLDDGSWRTVWSDSGNVNGIIAGGGFEILDQSVRRIGEQVEIYCYLRVLTALGPTTDGGVHSGNLGGDPLVCTVPAGFRPAVSEVPVHASSSFGSWGLRLRADGTAVVVDGPRAASLSEGDAFLFHAFYFGEPQ